MPLPPLADNLTVRAWLKYSWGGVQHELCYRMESTATTADIADVANALTTALRPYIGTADSFSALRYSPAGSNLSFPIPTTAVAGLSDNPTNDQQRASFVALAGRSSGGYRCRVTFFSNYWGTANDFRGPTTGSNAGGALYGAITAAAPEIVAKDGEPVVWNAYVNQGFNAYWQRQFR